jgi:exodeoxyribonuclease VII large subunit
MDVPDPEPTLRVSELTGAVQVALDVCFPDEVWVRGEISSLRRARSGHAYFQLVETASPGAPPIARIAVTLFATERAAVNATLKRVGGVRMTDGVEIRIRGRIAVFGPQGQLQLRMSAIDPAYTLGRLASDREAILRALAADGLLERNRLLPLSPRPRRIGLITSRASAAEADFLHELEQCGLAFDVLAVDTAVQGRDADRAMSAAIRRLAGRVEVIAIVRGGGARSDLAAFDSDRLARTIAAAPVPILTGIGHEVDSSVADLVAHTACKTPTACAAHLTARAQDFQRRAGDAWLATARRALAAADEHERRLAGHARASTRLGTASLGVAVARLDERRDRLVRAAPRAVEPAGLRLAALDARASALDPRRALARGWSITRLADGSLVRDPAQTPAGTELVTTLAGGELRSRVSKDGDG